MPEEVSDALPSRYNYVGIYVDTYVVWYDNCMSKRQVGDTRTRKLTKVASTSYSVTLPIEFIRHLGWRERQKLDITLKDDTLIIKDWTK